MFEYAQLRCFVMVAQELHFGRAAGRLNMTQPPLSRQIQLLEQQLHVKLLERSSRTVRLTPAGRLFLVDAKKILAVSENALLSARRIAVGEGGSLVLGFTASSGYSFLPALISKAVRDLPGIDIVLREMVSRDQIEALETSKIDVALLRPPIRQPNISKVCVQSETLQLALPEGHALCRKERITFSDLSNIPFVAYGPVEAKFFHDQIRTIYEKLNLDEPRYVQYMSQIHSVLALVSAGIGVSLIPAAACRLHFEGVVLRDVEAAEHFQVELHLAWHDDNENPALPALRQIAMELAP